VRVKKIQRKKINTNLDHPINLYMLQIALAALLTSGNNLGLNNTLSTYVHNWILVLNTNLVNMVWMTVRLGKVVKCRVLYIKGKNWSVFPKHTEK